MVKVVVSWLNQQALRWLAQPFGVNTFSIRGDQGVLVFTERPWLGRPHLTAT